MTKLFFGGGEVPKFRNLLAEAGNLPITVTFTQGYKDYTDALEYPGDIFLDSGAYSYNKPDSDKTFEEAYEVAAKFMSLADGAKDVVSMISEFDAHQLGKETITQFRKDFYDTLPADKFMPIWHPQDGREELEHLCSSYNLVGISQDDIHGDMSNTSLFSQMISRYKVRLHGVGITSKKLLEAVKWDSVSSTSWLTGVRYGETFVWTGREFKRYPKSYKDRARLSHRTWFIDNGFDYSKIEADDSDELLKLSIWSWQSFISSLSGVTNVPANKMSNVTENYPDEVNNIPISQRTGTPVQRQTVMLPVMAMAVPEHAISDDGEYSKPTLIVRSESMRICDTCFLKDKCPGFQPNSTCLYNIPIEIKTKDQLRALHDSLIEMQSQRVLFMKMAEDINGGYADPNLSSEIDRLNKMIATKEQSEKNYFSMTVTASESSNERKHSFMDKMLGSSAVAKLRELDAPIEADQIMEAQLVD